MCVYIYIYTHTYCIYVILSLSIYIYTYIYIYIYKHTYIQAAPRRQLAELPGAELLSIHKYNIIMSYTNIIIVSLL